MSMCVLLYFLGMMIYMIRLSAVATAVLSVACV